MIYFIRAPAGRIKIGTTIRLSQRLGQLAVEHGAGLEVLAVADGSFEVERTLHQRFAHLALGGEWFEPGDDLLEFIASDCRAWDGVDEAGGIRTVRVDPEFARFTTRLAALRGQSVAEYVDERLLHLVLGDLDCLLDQELAKMQGRSAAQT